MLLILVGDFHKLPPVGQTSIFSSNKYDLSQLIGSPLYDLFNGFELTEIMRQKDDYDFAVALNHLAIGELTDRDKKLFESRIVDESSVPIEAIHLFYSNEDVNQFNAKKINNCTEKAIIAFAQDKLPDNIVDVDKQKLLRTVGKMKVKDVGGFHHEIVLKVSIKYMIIFNIDTEDGLANGATGILRQIDCKQENSVPYRLWIEFPDEKIGKKIRSKMKIE